MTAASHPADGRVDKQTIADVGGCSVHPVAYMRLQALWRPQQGFPPHEWLPVEVMQHIFVLYAETHGQFLLPYKKTSCPPQVIVSQVCSTWRQLTFGSGTLWNNVVISELNDKALYVAENWLRRAQNTAAYVKVSLLRSPGLDLVHAFKTLLCPLRVRCLDILLFSEQLTEISTLSIDTFPHLEEIRIVLKAGKLIVPIPPHSFLTRVQFLLCADGPCPELLRSGRLPLNNLRFLDLQCVGIMPVQCISIFSQAALLEACRVIWYREWEDDPLVQQPNLILPNMKILSLEYHSQQRSSIVFDCITRYLVLPNLRKLLIRYRGFNSRLVSTIAERFNFCRLEELELRKVTPMAADDVLILTPSLRRATFSKNIVIDDETMEGLSSGSFGPLVESIKTNFRCDAKGILRMIERRKNISIKAPSRNLKHVGRPRTVPFRHVDFRSPEESEKYTREFEALREQGVHVVMNDYLNHQMIQSTPRADGSEVSDVWTKFVRPLHT